MAKSSFVDKLKVIFSKEKGKDICDYVYRNVIVPTAKNTVFTIGQVALAKFCDIDVANIPTLPNGHTAYSKVSDTRQPDKASYLPSTFNHNDITTIPFDNPRIAYKITSKMEEKMRGPLKKCTLADVYEAMDMGYEIKQTDYDIGWSGQNGVIGIGVLQRGNCWYIQAPPPRRLPGGML